MRIKHYRQELDRMKALRGNLTPSTDKEVEGLLRAADEKTFSEFFDTFFATREIPENRGRFDYAAIAKRARGAAGLY